MNLNEQELDDIRLYAGIHMGYKRIERDRRRGLVGCREEGRPMLPLPELNDEIRAAGTVLQYLAAQLLHDLNRMEMMLNAWEDHVHPVPNQGLKELIQRMASWILKNGGKP